MNRIVLGEIKLEFIYHKDIGGMLRKKLAWLLGVVVWCFCMTSFAQNPQSKTEKSKKSTTYRFEAEDVSGKGTNNFFFKVGKLKNRKLLDIRKDFRYEMRQSLKLLK